MRDVLGARLLVVLAEPLELLLATRVGLVGEGRLGATGFGGLAHGEEPADRERDENCQDRDDQRCTHAVGLPDTPRPDTWQVRFGGPRRPLPGGGAGRGARPASARGGARPPGRVPSAAGSRSRRAPPLSLRRPPSAPGN